MTTFLLTLAAVWLLGGLHLCWLCYRDVGRPDHWWSPALLVAAWPVVALLTLIATPCQGRGL